MKATEHLVKTASHLVVCAVCFAFASVFTLSISFIYLAPFAETRVVRSFSDFVVSYIGGTGIRPLYGVDWVAIPFGLFMFVPVFIFGVFTILHAKYMCQELFFSVIKGK